MRIHLVVPGPADTEQVAVLRELSAACLFQERGDEVSHSDQALADADVYFFYGGYEGMKGLVHSLVILDLRPGGDAAWAPYADVCLVGRAEDRAALVEVYGCEPERIFLVTGGKTVVDLVDKAVRDALPPAESKRRSHIMADHVPQPEQRAPRAIELALRLDAIEHQADIMLRGYRVRSKVPVVGPFIAWVRRNLTSHLREPYLDPTLERQVALNRELVGVLRELLNRQAALEARLARLLESATGDAHPARVQDSAPGGQAAARLHAGPLAAAACGWGLAKEESPVGADALPVIEIRDPTLDGPAISRLVQQRAEERQADSPQALGWAALVDELLQPPGAASGGGVSPEEFPGLRESMAELIGRAHLYEPDFRSEVPVLGPVIVAVRRLWNWMSTKWYVRPILWQQSEANVRTGRVISDLAQWHELDARRLGQLEARVAGLEARLAGMEGEGNS